MNPDAATQQKIALLSCPATYGAQVESVEVVETHMSLLFVAGATVYKLKKPVRFPYLDFSTLSRREAACRAELGLNRRLAPDIYLDTVAITGGEAEPKINGDGPALEWAVRMRTFDADSTLDQADIDVMKASRTCVAATKLQYDYLNDDVDDLGQIDYTRTNKVPEALRQAIADAKEKVKGAKKILPCFHDCCFRPSSRLCAFAANNIIHQTSRAAFRPRAAA